MIVVMVLSPQNAEFVPKYLLFLDTLIGRGLFFMFIGLRIIPLGQFYCLVAGMVTFSFGVLNCAIHWIFNDKGTPIRISTGKADPESANPLTFFVRSRVDAVRIRTRRLLTRSSAV